MRFAARALVNLACRAPTSSLAALHAPSASLVAPAAACTALPARCWYHGIPAAAADARPSSSSSGDGDRLGAAYSQQPSQQQQQRRAPPQPAVGSGTVSAEEAAKFAALASEWWDPRGPFAPLHGMNPVRCRFLRTALCAAFGRDPAQPRPLAGLRLLDVGCGGGLLSEPLARMGASVTGIDVNEAGTCAAAAHAALDPDLAGRLQYRTAAAEQLVAAGEQYDAVIASEVAEHVASLSAFCAALAALARPGGGVALSTLNRTPRSYLAAVLVAERLLGWVPPGTHEWHKFITPEELAMQMGEASGHGGPPLHLQLLAGMEYNPLSGRWALGRDTGINYIAWFAKPAPEAAQ